MKGRTEEKVVTPYLKIPDIFLDGLWKLWNTSAMAFITPAGVRTEQLPKR